MTPKFFHSNKTIGIGLLLIVLTFFFLNLEASVAKQEAITSSLISPNIELVPIAEGLMAEGTTDLEFSNDGRFFVVEKIGKIHILQSDEMLLDTPFLDISSKIATHNWEQGLLGLAFHPEYEENGYFYISYSDSKSDGATVISRFQVSADNPNLSDESSELVILTIPQPNVFHHGGDLSFGPDGYLYISTGDGAFADPRNNAQNGQLLLGKILRLDVNNPANGMNYGIPDDNPFVHDSDIRDEIWALGLRNPWRFSFDRLTGDMYIADVGHAKWEEVNFEPADSSGGLNYGWSCYEGNHSFNPKYCNDNTLYTAPVAEYYHQQARSITGGFVYRGAQYPQLQGFYLFSDFITGQL